MSPEEEKQKQKPYSVGEQFIDWIEKYWAFKRLYENKNLNDAENAGTYEYMRNIFIKKIDDIIYKKLNTKVE